MIKIGLKITVIAILLLLFCITITSAVTVLKYEPDYPINATKVRGNTTYQHLVKIMIGSNSSVGPLVMNIMFNASDQWMYEEHQIMLNNSPVLFNVSERDVTIENGTIHRISFYNDSLILPPPESPAKLVLKANLRSPNISGTFTLDTGGIYASDTTTLPLKHTTITVDATPPLITNVQTTSITINSATITWITDENSSSLVKYGTMSGNYTLSASDPTTVTLHSIVLTGLAPGTTYFYIVNSTDLVSNFNQSAEYSFTTLSPPSPPLPRMLGGGGGAAPPKDSDGDGLLDTDEMMKGTNLHNPDTDGDGVIDSQDPYPLDPALPAKPTPTPTPVPTPTPTPVPMPTPTPSPTPKPGWKISGFKAVFAIAELLIVAYLILRKRRT